MVLKGNYVELAGLNSCNLSHFLTVDQSSYSRALWISASKHTWASYECKKPYLFLNLCFSVWMDCPRISFYCIWSKKSITWVICANFGKKIARKRASAVRGCCPVLTCVFHVSVADEVENLSCFGQKPILDLDSPFFFFFPPNSMCNCCSTLQHGKPRCSHFWLLELGWIWFIK